VILFPAGAEKGYFLFATASIAAQPVSYPVHTEGSFPGGKAVGAWSRMFI